jgi:hypothetical protein
MAGLVPAIHVLATKQEGVDARHKAGHDVERALSLPASSAHSPAPAPETWNGQEVEEFVQAFTEEIVP